MSRQEPHAAAPPDPDQVQEVAQLLAHAENPLIITSGIGREESAVDVLVECAESFAIPVLVGVGNTHLNFPTSHSLHLGFDPTSFLPNADVVLVIDSDVAWYPIVTTPKRQHVSSNWDQIHFTPVIQFVAIQSILR